MAIAMRAPPFIYIAVRCTRPSLLLHDRVRCLAAVLSCCCCCNASSAIDLYRCSRLTPSSLLLHDRARRLAAVRELLMLWQCNFRQSFTLLLQMHAAVDAVA